MSLPLASARVVALGGGASLPGRLGFMEALVAMGAQIGTGASAGGLSLAFSLAGMDYRTAIDVCHEFSYRALIDRPPGTRFHPSLGLARGEALTNRADQILESLGHQYWKDFRAPPGTRLPGGKTHRLELRVCTLTLRNRPIESVQRSLDNGSIWATVTREFMFGSRIKTHDVPNDLSKLPSALRRDFDNQKVANWLIHSARHPFACQPYVVRDDNGRDSILVFDGAPPWTFTPYYRRIPETPTVIAEFHLDPDDLAEQQALDEKRYPGYLVIRAMDANPRAKWWGARFIKEFSPPNFCATGKEQADAMRRGYAEVLEQADPQRWARYIDRWLELREIERIHLARTELADEGRMLSPSPHAPSPRQQPEPGGLGLALPTLGAPAFE